MENIYCNMFVYRILQCTMYLVCMWNKKERKTHVQHVLLEFILVTHKIYCFLFVYHAFIDSIYYV